jgi:hypothetical protein
MSRVLIGETLAARLFAAEAAVDAAIVATAGLAAHLPAARAEALLSAVAGQRAFDGAAGAVSALVQARANLVQTHKTLAALARSLKLDDLDVGPVDKPEDDPPIGGVRPRVEFVHKAC